MRRTIDQSFVVLPYRLCNAHSDICRWVHLKGGKEMSREYLTDEQVEREIERLQASQFVKLAKKEEYVRNRRRQYLYCLRSYEKKGKELAESGITMDVLESMMNGDGDYGEC